MKRKKYPSFKAYFYNGFGKPELLATNVTQLLTDVKISDNYLGDMTAEVRTIVRDFKNNLDMESFKEELGYYQIFINPSLEELREENRRWFNSGSLDTYLEEFLTC